MQFTPQSIIERLNSNSFVKAKIIFYRPPSTEEIQYEFDHTFLITDENYFYRTINRLANSKYEYHYLEFDVPSNFLKKANRLPTYKHAR